MNAKPRQNTSRKMLASRLSVLLAGLFLAFSGVARAESPTKTESSDTAKPQKPFTLLWVRPPEPQAEKISAEAIHFLGQYIDRPFESIAWEISPDCYRNVRTIVEEDFNNPNILLVVGFFRRDGTPALFAAVPGHAEYWVDRDVPLDGDPTTLAPLWATIWGNLLSALKEMPELEIKTATSEEAPPETGAPPEALTAHLLPRKRVVRARFGTEFAFSSAWLPSGKNLRAGFALNAVYSPSLPFAALIGAEIYPPFGISHEKYDLDFLSIPIFAGGRYYWQSKKQELYLEVNAQARYSRFRIEDPSGLMEESRVHRTVIGMGVSAGYHYLFTDQISMFANYSLFWTPRGQEYAALGERLYLEPTFGMTLKVGMSMDWLK